MAKKKYGKCLLKPEIKDFQNRQVFQFEGKDARGYDFSVRISAIEPNSFAREIPRIVDADRVAMYFGGNHEKIDDIGTEIQISLGEKPEVFDINSAAMVYIPKGQPFSNSVIRNPDKVSWLLNITLPPKYVELD